MLLLMEIKVMMRQSALVKHNKVAQASDDHFMGDAEVTGSGGRIFMVVARGCAGGGFHNGLPGCVL